MIELTEWQEMVERFEKNGAAEYAIEWAKNVSGTQKATIDAMIDREARWALWGIKYASLKLTQDQIDRCAKKEPITAIRYAAEYLTQEQIDNGTKDCPHLSLRFAAQYLSKETLDECAKKEPWYALEFASQYLSKEQIDWCRKRYEFLKLCSTIR